MAEKKSKKTETTVPKVRDIPNRYEVKRSGETVRTDRYPHSFKSSGKKTEKKIQKRKSR